MLDAPNNLELYAHRGVSALMIMTPDGQFTDNTMAGFLAMFQNGFRGIECDLRLTGDNYCLVFHDPEVKRIPVATSLKKQIQPLTCLGSQGGLGGLEGSTCLCRIPRLANVIKLVKACQGQVVFDLKETQYPRMRNVLKKIIGLSRRHHFPTSRITLLFWEGTYPFRPLKRMSRKHGIKVYRAIYQEVISFETIKQVAEMGFSGISFKFSGSQLNYQCCLEAKRLGLGIKLYVPRLKKTQFTSIWHLSKWTDLVDSWTV